MCVWWPLKVFRGPGSGRVFTTQIKVQIYLLNLREVNCSSSLQKAIFTSAWSRLPSNWTLQQFPGFLFLLLKKYGCHMWSFFPTCSRKHENGWSISPRFLTHHIQMHILPYIYKMRVGCILPEKQEADKKEIRLLRKSIKQLPFLNFVFYRQIKQVHKSI